MTPTLPLLHSRFARVPDTAVAWRQGAPIALDRFLADVATLAEALPASGHVLNVCADRYRFSVGLAAAMVCGQASLLPPSTDREMLRQLLLRFPDSYCLTETAATAIDLPQTLYPVERPDAHLDAHPDPRGDRGLAIPLIPADQIVAHVFTSGSTGVPVPHTKRWGALVANVRAEAARLGMTDNANDGDHGALAIVATVPPQHMYGLESTVLLAWQSGAALVAERPFYPADIIAALDRLASHRMLVTTPFHLRALLDNDLVMPTVERVVSATAPLSQALAAEAERRFRAPLLEIYGCTETGQIASKRPVETARWRLFSDVSLNVIDDTAWASGGHVEEPTALADAIELADDFPASREFALIGRAQDLVNIAGKRTSLGYLNTHLNAIPGVVDGAFFMPDDVAPDAVTRVGAVVVAPTLDAKRIALALRKRIDPAFLPRPLHLVDALPRNATGKVTRAVLDAVLNNLNVRTHEPKHDGASHDSPHNPAHKLSQGRS